MPVRGKVDATYHSQIQAGFSELCIYTLQPPEKPHFIIIHFTCIGRWMGGSCMGAGGG